MQPFNSAPVKPLWALVLFISVQLLAQETSTRWTPEAMIKFKRVGGVEISADGKWIAYTLSRPLMEAEKSEFLTHIWIVSADGKTNCQLTYGDKSCTGPAFSPDGNYLAFVSPRGTSGKTQIWVMRTSGGEAEQVTNAKSSVNAFKWSHDSKLIAYTMNDPETDQEEKDKKEKRDMIVEDTNFKFSVCAL